MTKLFYENDLSLDTIWRSIVLLGKNNKTYKFALAKSLIELANAKKQRITISELAPVFAKHTVDHVRTGNAQGVDEKKSGPFLKACQQFISGEITEDQLYQITEKNAFDDVIVRFHVVNNDKTPIVFYDESAFKSSREIIIRDEIFKLLQSSHGPSLIHEIEARWKLVEVAWQLKIPAALLEVDYDSDKKLFFIKHNEEGKTTRVNVTKSRDALNGYQKGHCFYCFDHISVDPTNSNLCHVDHFFPHILFDKLSSGINFNAVWNLVLACSGCNLSKSAQVPGLEMLERLHVRNEFYITSHLPLRESILKTGGSETARRKFLQDRFTEAGQKLITKFNVELKHPPRF